MSGKTEYTRMYIPFTSPPKSPIQPIPAGRSSAEMNVTQEPPVGMKKKVKQVDSKVKFLTGHGDSESSPDDKENKAFKFKVGFRRPNPLISTTYQREYDWPDPPPSETPLLDAQSMLHRSKYPTSTQHNGIIDTAPPLTTNGHHHHHHDRAGDAQFQHDQDPYHKKHSTDGQPKSDSGLPLADKSNTNGDTTTKPAKFHKHNPPKNPSPKNPGRCAEHHQHARGQKQRQFIRELMSKQASGSGDRKQTSGSGDRKQVSGSGDRKAQRAKRAHKRMVRQFVTEYQRNFGKSYVGKSSKKKGKVPPVPAGMPRVLTDVSDPRLLKHSPLPTNTVPDSLPHGGWLTDYRANYTSPSEEEYTGPVVSSHPKPDSNPGDSPPKNVQLRSEEPVPPPFSWYDQLVELRERAAKYKKRAEGVNIRRLLPMTRQDLDNGRYSPPPSSHTLTPSQTTTSSSPTASDSVSCTYSDCPHHIKKPPSLSLVGPELKKPKTSSPSSQVSLEVQDIEEEKPQETHHTSTPPLHTKPHPPTSTDPAPNEHPGRVQTPAIQKSFSDYRRHHLDRTTPVAGGLFISPCRGKQPSEVILPVPSQSAKYRRDMKSSAPISPAPVETKDEGVQIDISFSQSSGSSPPSVKAGSPAMHPQSVQDSSLSYHTGCAQGSKQKSSSIRKLDFKPSHTKSTGSTTVPKSYSYRVQGYTPANKTNCDICGAHLKPPPVISTGLGTSVHPATSKSHLPQSSNNRSSSFQGTHPKPYQTQTQSGVTSSLSNGGLSSLKKPQVSVLNTQQAHTGQRPPSSTNYMTRLPPQVVETRPKEFDETSLASLSLSSCSVASDLLRKAQERRDYFWSQPPRVATT